jgi:hypothetical protein
MQIIRKKSEIVPLLFSSFFILVTIAYASNSEAKKPEISEYDWNNDGSLDRFIFFPNHESLPGNFYAFEIQLSGKGTFKFSDTSQTRNWVALSSDASSIPKEMVKKRNLLKSKYAAIFAVKFKKKDFLVLCLFGFTPTNNPGSLTILALNDSGIPAFLYYETADLIDILDLDNDGSSEIILSLQHEYEENYHKTYHYSTYEPFYVYSILNKYTLSFDLKLTEQYNRINYVGWVGLDTNHSYIIWENPATKKSILTTLEEAKKKYFK